MEGEERGEIVGEVRGEFFNTGEMGDLNGPTNKLIKKKKKKKKKRA